MPFSNPGAVDPNRQGALSLLGPNGTGAPVQTPGGGGPAAASPQPGLSAQGGAGENPIPRLLAQVASLLPRYLDENTVNAMKEFNFTVGEMMKQAMGGQGPQGAPGPPQGGPPGPQGVPGQGMGAAAQAQSILPR